MLTLYLKIISALVVYNADPIKTVPQSAVVSELSAGRLGDNLVALSHAAWLAYKYNLVLSYVPFPFSDKFALCEEVEKYTAQFCKKYRYVNRCSLTTDVEALLQKHVASMLTIIPYFPDFSVEYSRPGGFDGAIKPLFSVGWKDRDFINWLRHLLVPSYPIEFPDLPHDRVCVALHLRFGGGFDLPCADGIEGNSPASDKLFPLKCPPIRYYIERLIALHDELGRVPLYVYVFTDERDPGALVERIRPYIVDHDIVFDYRRVGNAHDRNVIEDFAFMQKFSYMIRPQSNLSYMAARVSPSLLMDVEPHAFVWEGKWLNVTHVRMLYADGHEIIKPCYAHVYR